VADERVRASRARADSAEARGEVRRSRDAAEAHRGDRRDRGDDRDGPAAAAGGGADGRGAREQRRRLGVGIGGGGRDVAGHRRLRLARPWLASSAPEHVGNHRAMRFAHDAIDRAPGSSLRRTSHGPTGARADVQRSKRARAVETESGAGAGLVGRASARERASTTSRMVRVLRQEKPRKCSIRK